jgi:hypothetical protein
MRPRHPKQNPDVRCCWVCGKPGGGGFTSALRDFGYDVPKDTVAQAHEGCMSREQRRLARKRRQLARSGGDALLTRDKMSNADKSNAEAMSWVSRLGDPRTIRDELQALDAIAHFDRLPS